MSKPSTILRTISDTESQPNDELLKAIESAINEHGIEDFASYLMVEARAPLHAEKIAYAIDVAAWIVEDNGSSACRTMESWIESDDDNRIWVALHTETYPYIDAKKMYRKLAELSKRKPRFRPRCEKLIAMRKQDQLNHAS